MPLTQFEMYDKILETVLISMSIDVLIETIVLLFIKLSKFESEDFIETQNCL